MVEHQLPKLGVAGSSPVTRSKKALETSVFPGLFLFIVHTWAHIFSIRFTPKPPVFALGLSAVQAG